MNGSCKLNMGLSLLLMSATGDMGRECHKFCSRLSEKRGQNYNVVASWIRRKIFFSLMNSIGLCVRGSRTVFKTESMMTSIQEDAITSGFICSIR